MLLRELLTYKYLPHRLCSTDMPFPLHHYVCYRIRTCVFPTIGDVLTTRRNTLTILIALIWFADRYNWYSYYDKRQCCNIANLYPMPDSNGLLANWPPWKGITSSHQLYAICNSMIRDISIIYMERGICTLIFEWVWRYQTVVLDYRNTSLRLSPFPYFRLFMVLLTPRLSRAHLVVVCYNTYQAPLP